MTITSRGAAAPTSGNQDHVALNTAELDLAVATVQANAERWAATSARQRPTQCGHPAARRHA